MNPNTERDHIVRLTDAVRKAAAGDYGVRVGNPSDADELDTLASAIDELLDSVEPRITESERERDALREATEQYRHLEANSPGMVYTYCLHPDGSYSFPFVNAASRELFDVEPEVAMGDGALISELIHPADRERRDVSILRSAKTLEPFREELRHIVNGEVRWYDCRSRPELQSSGGILWTGIILEITKRKRAEEALRESEAKYRRLHESMSDAFARADVGGRIEETNRAFQAMVGYSEEELLQMTYNDLTPEKWHAFEKQIASEQVLVHGYSEVFEKEYRKKDGSIIPVELRVFLLRDAAGQPTSFWAIARDITDRKRAEEALRRETSFKESVVKRAAEGIVVCHTIEAPPYVRFTVWNDRMREITGYTLEEVNRSGWPRMACSDSKIGDQPAPRIEQIRPGDDVVAGEWTITRKDGSERVLELATSLLQSDDGRASVLGLMNDVTERVRARSTIEEANRQLEQSLSRARRLALEASQASRAKSEFLANISHEIRTPLSGVIGMAELLIETVLSEEQQEFADTIYSSARTLLALLNDILDFSKIEAGKLELETLDCDLHETVEQVCGLLGSSAKESGLDLICLVEPDVPFLLRCDPGRLRQVLVNLVGNAVKFTERGEVSLTVSLEREDPEEATLRFSVSDTGLGIESESLAKLFQPFSQADASTTRRYGGTGLGLSICRGLVDQMGGELHASSKIGVGSTFWFTLTLAKQAGKSKAREAVEDALIGVRVLVADDCAANRRLVKVLAESWGCRCEEAGGGQQALDMLRAAAGQGDPFRVAILDAQMPGMVGKGVVEAVREDTRLTETAAVLMRSNGGDHEARGTGQTSLAAHLSKPVRRSRLKQSLRAAVRATGSSEEAPLARLGHCVQRSQKRLRILVAEDNPVNQKVLLALLEKLGCRAVGVDDGREALSALGTAHYDLVLMDCQMPIMDGYQAAREIRDPDSKVLNHEVPIVAVTAHAIMGEEEKCLRAGMNAYLTKPVSLETLNNAIRSWV